MNQENFINNKELREQSMNRVDILEKVKDLLLLPNTEFATTEQVATYFEVGREAIQSLIKDNRDELVSDGFRLYKKQEILNVLKGQLEINIPNRGQNLFPKRAILRVAMLLRDSEVAKEIRTRLLDIVHDSSELADNNETTIVEKVVEEISEEKQLVLAKVEAELKGDWAEVSVINAKLFALKNKRIIELENEVNIITTHALTLTESRDIINKLVRKIATKEYNNMFGKAFSELYSMINYKLGINIKARNKKKNDSYLHTLTEEETFRVEEIVRTWANDLEIDINKALNLAS